MKKRKLRNRLEKLITVGMGLMAFASFMLHAFHKSSAIYGVLFFVGIGWVMIYLQRTGGRIDG